MHNDNMIRSYIITGNHSIMKIVVTNNKHHQVFAFYCMLPIILSLCYNYLASDFSLVSINTNIIKLTYSCTNYSATVVLMFILLY